ncbi:hypothetical protein FFWV33_06605 [Flavobacterium faecale]|uniref:Uncharacterized protein n=1 Tax=Flavobacterium faecale TaxID=1355330 RepID=A0A2S1LC09_9FLAO|nr:hypothetical protein [Flavobacterium faecale]AWG21227.1 hypothetical protein FFWV33_06605 [Flavobacterium faecale]
MSVKNSLKINSLGYYQVIGGIVGIGSTMRFLPNFAIIHAGIALLFGAIFIMYGFSIFCGYLLLKNRYNEDLKFSTYNQFIQVVGF